MKHVAGLHFADHGPVAMLGRFDALDRMMKMRVEFLADGFDPRETLLRKCVPELASDEFEAFEIFGGTGISLRGESAIKSVKHGKKVFDQYLDTAMPVVVAFSLNALPIVLEVSLSSNQRIEQLLLFGLELLNLFGKRPCRGRIVHLPGGLRFSGVGRRARALREGNTRRRPLTNSILFLIAQRHESTPLSIFGEELRHEGNRCNDAFVVHTHRGENPESPLNLVVRGVRR
jgi:hypothetical protein